MATAKEILKEEGTKVAEKELVAKVEELYAIVGALKNADEKTVSAISSVLYPVLGMFKAEIEARCDLNSDGKIG